MFIMRQIWNWDYRIHLDMWEISDIHLIPSSIVAWNAESWNEYVIRLGFENADTEPMVMYLLQESLNS